MTQRTITISCAPKRRALLEELAAANGFYLPSGRPSISRLMQAIADGDLPLGEPSPKLKKQAEIARLKAELASLS